MKQKQESIFLLCICLIKERERTLKISPFHNKWIMHDKWRVLAIYNRNYKTVVKKEKCQILCGCALRLQISVSKWQSVENDGGLITFIYWTLVQLSLLHFPSFALRESQKSHQKQITTCVWFTVCLWYALLLGLIDTGLNRDTMLLKPTKVSP